MSKARIIWLTGLSGAGKTTLSNMLLENLENCGHTATILDGDQIRKMKNIETKRTKEDILIHNQFVAEHCVEISEEFDFIIVSIIAPFEEARQNSRRIIGENYFEVYLDATIDSVIERDVKGLYKKALNNEIENFVGISPKVPYEIPKQPDCIVNTDQLTAEESFEKLMEFASTLIKEKSNEIR